MRFDIIWLLQHKGFNKWEALELVHLFEQIPRIANPIKWLTTPNTEFDRLSPLAHSLEKESLRDVISFLEDRLYYDK